MKSEQNVPQIRFKGYTDAWEQRRVKNTAPLQRGFDLPTNQMEKGIYPVVMSNGIGGHHSQYKVKGPGIVTGRSGTIGKLHYIEENYWPHNTTLWVTDFYGNNQKFIYYMYQYLNLSRFSTGSGVPTLNRNDVHNEVVCISSVDEQKKISDYLTNLDRLITLHKRKLETLKKLKKSMLQKMFPKNGSVYPKIRFSGYTDAWEQRRLGEHSEIVAGGTPNTAHSEYWNPKEIPWMSSGEINNKVIYTTDNMISKIGFSNSSAKWVKDKSVLIALAGQGKTRGTVAITEIPLTTNQSIAAIQPDDFLYYKYLFQNLEERYDELRSISSGDGTRGGLNKQIISDLIVLAPNINEQRKIGNFLCDIDRLITLHQRKLETLKKLKKSMLQKMFI